MGDGFSVGGGETSQLEAAVVRAVEVAVTQLFVVLLCMLSRHDARVRMLKVCDFFVGTLVARNAA